MKHPFYINLVSFAVWLITCLIIPVVGIMAVFPFGLLQVVLSIAILAQPATKIIQRLATAHLVLAVFPLLSLPLMMEAVIGVCAALSILLFFGSFYISYLQYKSVEPLKTES